jgi:hypothetical protein
VGILSDWRARGATLEWLDVGTTDMGIRSPWAGDLTRIVIPDFANLFGLEEFECVTREEAMSVPAVVRARAILISLIANKPLKAWRGAELVPEQPSFLYRTPGILGPSARMARTVDDLIFYPWSLWLTERGAEDGGRRPILDAVHCPYSKWKVNDADLIEVANRDGGWDVAQDDEVLLIPGPWEGLLAHGSRTVRGAADLERAWVDRARNPSPITELHLTEDIALDDDEVEATRDAWTTARRARGGAVAVTPSNVDVIDHGTADAALFIEGRNSSRMDIASMMNMPGAILDATSATASLTYVTQEGTRTSLYDLTLPYWLEPIAARLSQDDVVPRGQSVRFDFTSLAPTAPLIVTED